MLPGLARKYKRAYSSAAIFVLLIVPAGSYVLFLKYHLLKTLPLFPSVTAWAVGVVLTWIAGFLCAQMAGNWNDAIDATFRKKGFEGRERIKMVWNLTIIPAILGSLLMLFTFLEIPPQGDKYSAIRIIIIAIGFIPVTFYGLMSASRIADRIAGGGSIQKELPADYLRAKWWPIVVVVMTMILTPFLGAGIAAAQIRRLVPRYRLLFYTILVLSGFFITVLMTPLAASMKKIRQSGQEAYPAFALYSALTLFTGAAYVLIIKIGILFKKQA